MKHSINRSIKSCGRLVAAFTATVVMGLTAAHAAFPDKPIKLVVPFAPGGGADLMRVLKLALAGAVLTIGAFANAQDYPHRPIRMVIPYTPGGSIDTVGRLVADQLQRQLGQPIVIENTPGASACWVP